MTSPVQPSKTPSNPTEPDVDSASSRVSAQLVPRSPKRPPDLKSSTRHSLTPADVEEIALKVKYRRIPEWKRKSNFQTRLIMWLLRWALYIALIPAMLSGAVIGMSLKLGATWDESVKNVNLVAQTTLETYETHYDLIKLSGQILFKLDEENANEDMDMIVYAAEVRSKMSELSASLDRALAKYLKQQVARSKQRKALAKAQGASGDAVAVAEAPITLSDVLFSGILGALSPLLIYWLLSYLLTRFWLNIRARETVRYHRSRIERAILKRTPVRDLLDK